MSQTMTFHNKATIKMQAQVFTGNTLVGTCQVPPGTTGTLSAGPELHDIYFKNGATGWELARKLNSPAQEFTLTQNQGRFSVT